MKKRGLILLFIIFVLNFLSSCQNKDAKIELKTTSYVTYISCVLNLDNPKSDYFTASIYKGSQNIHSLKLDTSNNLFTFKNLEMNTNYKIGIACGDNEKFFNAATMSPKDKYGIYVEENTFIYDGENHSLQIFNLKNTPYNVKADNNIQKEIGDYLVTFYFGLNEEEFIIKKYMHIVPNKKNVPKVISLVYKGTNFEKKEIINSDKINFSSFRDETNKIVPYIKDVGKYKVFYEIKDDLFYYDSEGELEIRIVKYSTTEILQHKPEPIHMTKEEALSYVLDDSIFKANLNTKFYIYKDGVKVNDFSLSGLYSIFIYIPYSENNDSFYYAYNVTVDDESAVSEQTFDFNNYDLDNQLCISYSDELYDFDCRNVNKNNVNEIVDVSYKVGTFNFSIPFKVVDKVGPVISYIGKSVYTVEEIKDINLNDLFRSEDDIDMRTSHIVTPSSIKNKGRHIVTVTSRDSNNNETEYDYVIYVDYENKRASELTNVKDLSNNKQNHKLPSTGNIRVPVILVDLINFSNRIEIDSTYKSDINKVFNGQTNSVSSFYKESSYNKLNLSFDIIQNPIPFDIEMNALLRDTNASFLADIINQGKAKINYTIYDQNADSYLDAAWIIYNVPHRSNSMLWAYVSDYDYNVKVNGLSMSNLAFASYDFINPKDQYNSRINSSSLVPNTYIHETAHLFGLIDNYDSTQNSLKNKLSLMYGFDMMDANIYDISAANKILLNWIDPLVVENNQEINLESVESGDCLILKKKFDNDLYSKYFVVEFISGTNLNQNIPKSIRVTLVNFRLKNSGEFFYTSTTTEKNIQTITKSEAIYLNDFDLYNATEIFFAKDDKFSYNSDWSDFISFTVLDIENNYASLKIEF